MADTSINELKGEIATKLIGDGDLTTELGGEYVYYRRPMKEVVVDDSNAVITYWFVARPPRTALDEYGIIDITVQIDIWSTSEDKNDRILKILDGLLYQWRAQSTTWKVKRMLRQSDSAMPRDESGIAQLSTTWEMAAHKEP